MINMISTKKLNYSPSFPLLHDNPSLNLENYYYLNFSAYADNPGPCILYFLYKGNQQNYILSRVMFTLQLNKLASLAMKIFFHKNSNNHVAKGQ